MKRLLLHFVLGAFLLAGLATSHAQVAQTPLIVGGASVSPNLVFTFDDSGSMEFECLPENLCVGTGISGKYVGTMPGGVGGDFKDGIATTVNTSLFHRQMRSAGTNTQYYNPNIRYTPWLKADGTIYPSYAATAAPIDPRVPGTTVNLVSTQTFTTTFCTSTTSCANASQSYYPAQYWNLTSGTGTVVGNFTQVVINGTILTTFSKGAARTDCLLLTCSLAEERQNFSNWFTYYRNRLLAAIGGTAKAFDALPADYRLGYGRINMDTTTAIDGVNGKTVVRGLRPFSGADRTAFYTWLFSLQVATGGTPLRRALGDVGEYYRRTDNKGPWGNVPGTEDTSAHLTCRRAFHLLMTDGAWNNDAASNSAAAGNVDGTSQTTPITGPNSQSYLYTRAYPYRDSNSGTLADVAMYYWLTDLRPDLANDVKGNAGDPAFWQHMVNYTIGFGVNGKLLNPDDEEALKAGTKLWGNPASDADNKVDDLWHAAVNSRGLSANAADQQAYADAVRAVITNIDERNGSDAGVAVSGRFLTSTSRKYKPEYRTNQWTGELSAVSLDENGNDGPIAWVASQRLPAAASRNIYTYKNSTVKGVTFTWAGLTAQSMTATLGVTAAAGPGLVNYLRGDATGEGTTYRSRQKKLGDIINSSPALVKDALDSSYDFLPSTVGQVVIGTATFSAATSYREFLRNKKFRTGQVYVGANDGMFHVFSDVNGTETFAFIPNAVLGDLKNLSTSPYEHQYFVDGPVTEADVHDISLGTSGGWRNIVLGSGGAGAKNLFAINSPVPVTPSTGTLTQTLMSPGPSDILWEVSSSTTNFGELGYLMQTPEVGLMRNGQWAVVVGNGQESASGRAQLFIINALTGALIKRIDTGIPTLLGGNGLGAVRVMRDSSRQIVAAYAGDLRGNVWKFDLSSTNSNDWVVAYSSTSLSPKPLFQAVNRNGQAEPITAAPAVTRHPGGGVLVVVGTGKLFETPDTSNTQERTIYGLWDKAAVGVTSATPSLIISGTSTLVLQTLTTIVSVTTSTPTATQTDYGVSSNEVDYSTKMGWRLPLTLQAGQRLVYDLQFVGPALSVETIVPGASVATCSASSGVSPKFVLDPFTGGPLGRPVFDTNNDGVIDNKDNANVVGFQTSADGQSAIIFKGGTGGATGVAGTSSGTTGYYVNTTGSKLFNVGGSSSVRRSWKQIFSPPPVTP
ncbi:MAG: PilC/PilY family type IV pilus protein [Pseudomonadota bacterium]